LLAPNGELLWKGWQIPNSEMNGLNLSNSDEFEQDGLCKRSPTQCQPCPEGMFCRFSALAGGATNLSAMADTNGIVLHHWNTLDEEVFSGMVFGSEYR
jgi:hypothetical protein